MWKFKDIHKESRHSMNQNVLIHIFLFMNKAPVMDRSLSWDQALNENIGQKKYWKEKTEKRIV